MSRVMNGAVTQAPETSRVRNNTGYLFLPSRLRRGVVLKWLRRTHGWLGLWGGALGLLFGFTGILMNHREVMKIPALKAQQSNLQIALENPSPTDPNALAEWLQQRLQLSKPATRVHADQAQKVPWGTGAIVQPERWQINFINPQQSFQAEYWVGNAYVSVKQSENNAFAFLTKLHTASGVHAAWILLADTVAGSFIVLALTGVLLWSRLHGERLLALGLALGSLSTAVALAWLSL